MSFAVDNNILKGIVKRVNVDCKLNQIVLHALNRHPTDIAQIDADTDKKTTYGEMKDRSIRCAVWMKKLLIRPGDIVVAVTHNHSDSYIPIFATFLVDAVFNAWNLNITLDLAQQFMKKFTPKLIFATEKVIHVLKDAATLENLNVQFVVFGRHSGVQSLHKILDIQAKEEIDNFELVNERSPKEVAAIMLSSSNTGLPKGAMLSHRSIVAMTIKYGPNKSSINLWYSTLDRISCICLIFQTLLGYGTRIISNRNDAESFLQTAEKYKVMLTLATPMLILQLAKCDLVEKYDLGSLKTFFVAGCKNARQVLDAVQQKLSTAFVHKIYEVIEVEGVVNEKTPELSKNVDSIGFVGPNYHIKIVDLVSGIALGPNQPGEMHIKSSHIFLGYYNDPEATQKTFDDNGWYRTGDIGYYNEAGEIFIMHSFNNIIIYKNILISPTEIEEVLLSHPGVQEAAVIGLPHETDGDWPAAFVKKVPGSKLSEDDLVKHTSVLEDYKILRGGIYCLDKMPRTNDGTIESDELRQLAHRLISHKSSWLFLCNSTN